MVPWDPPPGWAGGYPPGLKKNPLVQVPGVCFSTTHHQTPREGVKSACPPHPQGYNLFKKMPGVDPKELQSNSEGKTFPPRIWILGPPRILQGSLFGRAGVFQEHAQEHVQFFPTEFGGAQAMVA